MHFLPTSLVTKLLMYVRTAFGNDYVQSGRPILRPNHHDQVNL